MAAVGKPAVSCDKHNVELVHYFSDGYAAEGAEYILTHAKGTRKGKIGADGTAFEINIPKGPVKVKYSQIKEKKKLKLKTKKLKQNLDKIKSKLKSIVDNNRKLLQDKKLWDPEKMLTSVFITGTSKNYDANGMISSRTKEDQFFINFHSSLLKFDFGGIKKQLEILHDTGDIEYKQLDAIYVRIQLLAKNKQAREVIISFSKEISLMINGVGVTSHMDKRITSSLLLRLFSPGDDFIPKSFLFDPGKPNPPVDNPWNPPKSKPPTGRPPVKKPPRGLFRAFLSFLARAIVWVIAAIAAVLTAEILVIILIVVAIVVIIVAIIWWLFSEKEETREVPDDYEYPPEIRPKPELREPLPKELEPETQLQPQSKGQARTKKKKDTTTIPKRSARPKPGHVKQRNKRKCDFCNKAFNAKCNICTKTKVPTAEATGNSTTLKENIALNSGVIKTGFPRLHQWYANGPGNGNYSPRNSIQAHHLILSSIVKMGDPKRVILACNYNINKAYNGAMLPRKHELACQLGVVRHMGNHLDQDATPPQLSYRAEVESKVQEKILKAKNKDYCNNHPLFVEEMRSISIGLLKKLQKHAFVLTDEGAYKEASSDSIKRFPIQAYKVTNRKLGCQNSRGARIKMTIATTNTKVRPDKDCKLSTAANPDRKPRKHDLKRNGMVISPVLNEMLKIGK